MVLVADVDISDANGNGSDRDNDDDMEECTWRAGGGTKEVAVGSAGLGGDEEGGKVLKM